MSSIAEIYCYKSKIDINDGELLTEAALEEGTI
jgi:hypothetical protein